MPDDAMTPDAVLLRRVTAAIMYDVRSLAITGEMYDRCARAALAAMQPVLDAREAAGVQRGLEAAVAACEALVDGKGGEEGGWWAAEGAQACADAIRALRPTPAAGSAP